MNRLDMIYEQLFGSTVEKTSKESFISGIAWLCLEISKRNTKTEMTEYIIGTIEDILNCDIFSNKESE